MGWIIAIIVGGIAGWLASLVMARDASMGIFWNIIVGIIGGWLANRYVRRQALRVRDVNLITTGTPLLLLLL